MKYHSKSSSGRSVPAPSAHSGLVNKRGPVLCWIAIGGLALACPLLLGAEDKDPPVIKAVSPLGIVDGVTATLSIRGFRLADVTELKFPDLKTAPVYKIKSKGSAPKADRVPADKIGDTRMEFELLLPVDTPPGVTTFLVIGPNGKSEPRKLVVLEATKTVAEKEPNDGFSEAQEVILGQTITGVLTGSSKTDIFSFTGETGQRVKFDVQAAQLGSLLNPFISIQNADGRSLMEVDDGPKGADPVVEITLPKSGRYFLSIKDAQDSSSPMHAYLIRTLLE